MSSGRLLEAESQTTEAPNGGNPLPPRCEERIQKENGGRIGFWKKWFSSSAELSVGSVARRLAVCFLTLLLLDYGVGPLLRQAEHRRYDSGVPVRFGSSDLFLIGPLSDYLRKHPVGARSRVAFFGNSSIWGYGLTPQETVSAAFQRLSPRTQVFNFGMNGFEMGSAYLMAKAVIDAVDVFYVFDLGSRAHPMLPRLIPVSVEDAQRFGLEQPPALEQAFNARLGFWKLHRYANRLQGAWFGSSMRQYVYLNKSKWIQKLLEKQPGQLTGTSVELQPVLETGHWQAKIAFWKPREKEKYEYAGGKRSMSSRDQALLNAQFRPYVLVASLKIPSSWLLDGQHYTASGATAVAKVLYQNTAKPLGLEGS
ncbi:MAG: hypothetical protein HYT88_04750 [Candidatus Omnitrophica bacterium]|nr:hypothetical protein [Candidatus Omnitrophota bacterium]